MSNINNITTKILDGAKAKKEEILKTSQEEERKIIDKKTSQAKEEEKIILEKAKVESISKRERIISNAELSVRNEKLEAKQQVIEKVFDKALEKLSALKGEEYLNFVKDRITSLDIGGDEKLIISSDDKEIITEEFVKSLNKELSRLGKKGNLILSGETGDFKGGFILEKSGIEINNAFEALISSMKDELEYEVAKVLFS